MNSKIQLPPSKVIGIAVRTTNANGQAMKDLGELWGRFYSEAINSKIPGKASEEIYAVYTDYETDHTGAYTTIIGCKVNSLEHVPQGMTGKEIAGADYFQFTGKGEMPDAVVNCWKEIWNKNDELKRTYTADFEVYGGQSADPDSAVEIFIATKA